MGGGVKQATRKSPRSDGHRPMSAGARRRENARRAALRKRRLRAYGIPAAVVAAVVLAAVALSLSGTSNPKVTELPTTGPVTVAGRPRATPIQIGERIPDFSANLLRGGQVRWADYQGRPTVLELWAPWCPHCQRELPVVSSVLAGYPNVKLFSIVTAVDLHPGPTPDGYLRSRGLTLATALDDENGTLGTALGLQSFPTVYFVDASGIVRQVSVGESSPEQIRANLALIVPR
jgi:cytochrome c biogenesis protein CcmG/thiol:disulfide interchange protein DsbE